MNLVGSILVIAALVVLLYAYLLYPFLLKLLALVKRPPAAPPAEAAAGWPRVSIVLAVYNGADQIRDTLDALLRVDYPADRLQVLVVSDASTDGTDEIVGSYGERGVELLRMPVRGGKTAAETAARPYLRGEIVVNTDATVRVAPDAVQALVRRFADPTVGVASGRDVSIARLAEHANRGESAYVDYEMRVRQLETRLGGIIGASGCLYAIRAHLNDYVLPSSLSRDFASALVAREHGYRAVSVEEAICYVPRTGSLRAEYRRKVRTITRGMQTLCFKRALLNPLRYPLFAWMIVSHKMMRWLLPWAALGALLGLGLLAPEWRLADVAVALGVTGLAWAALGLAWPEGRHMPRLLSLPAFVLAGNAAAMHASLNALRGHGNPVWEPTRRPDSAPSAGARVESGQPASVEETPAQAGDVDSLRVPAGPVGHARMTRP